MPPSRAVVPTLRRNLSITLAVTALLVGLVAANATADHAGDANLPGSNFEIDVDANLVDDADYTPEDDDWATVTEIRAIDLATGQADNSYKGGVKEDTACPGETTGSIPNNKSDLLTFHVYEEPGDPGFLNLAWSRVSEPSGTTLMDFEFNQSTTPCTNGPNVVRTPGDLLIEYAIDQGGARADITGRFWNGSAWGNPIDLDTGTGCGGGPCATGTINQSPIAAAASDGIITSGSKQARTFGEAQIDLRLIFDDQSCTSFGSAMLKSRSSDSFTSQLKDFIAPVPIDLQNCGNVIIRKQTDPDEDPNTTEFGYTKDFATDPTTADTFVLTDDGVRDFGDAVLFGNDYTVTEDVLPAGWDFVDLDCSASTDVDYTIVDATVTFDIDSDDDVLDCTYTNVARGSITVVKRTENAVGTFDFTSTTLTPSTFALTTTATSTAGQDSATFGDLGPGTYDVAESGPPNGWELVSATCDDGSDPASIGLSAGEDVTCTFVNRASAALTVTKVTQDGAGSFDYVSTTLDPASFTLTTTAAGAAGSDSRDFTGIAPGAYDVAEDVPTGWDLVSATCDNGDDPAAITLGVGDDVECTFTNAPQEGAILVAKTRKHAADGPGDHPHAGVDFTVTGGELPAGGTVVTTDANGQACLDGLLLSQFAGDYTVTESLPTGYAADGALAKDVTVTTASACGDGDEATVSFGNTPLTDVTVSVDSQVDGGTSTVVSCWAGTDTSGPPDHTVTTDASSAGGDGSLDVGDLLPTDPEVTLTCQVTVDP